MKNKVLTTKNIALIAILGAMSALLMLMSFSLPLFPSFYQIDLGDVPVIFGGLLMGPLAGVLVQLIKILLNFILDGSITGGVGELANFIMGASFVLTTAYFYKKDKSKKGAIKGLILGAIAITIVGALTNYFILLPAYSFYLKIPLEALIDMGHQLIPAITDKLSFVLLATVPFNLIKAALTCIIVVMIYKPMSVLLKKYR